MPRFLPDGFERVVLFDQTTGMRIDMPGRFLSASNSQTATVEKFAAADGANYPTDRTAVVEFVATEGTSVEALGELARVSPRWSLVALSIGRHVQFYERSPVELAPRRDGAGGFAGESFGLSSSKYDPTVEQSDNLLAVLGWRDVYAAPAVLGLPGGTQRRLPRRLPDGRERSRRSLAWLYTGVNPPVVSVGGDALVFDQAWALDSGLIPFPCPGAELACVSQATDLLPSFTFHAADGSQIGPEAASTVTAGVRTAKGTAPAGTFYVRAAFSGTAPRAFTRPRLFVTDPGPSVALFVDVAGEPLPPAPPEFAGVCVAPDTPAGLVGTPGVDGLGAEVVVWTWGAVAGVDGYFLRVGRGAAGPFPVFASTLSTDPDGGLTATTADDGAGPYWGVVAAFKTL